jgi:hypothetical protein
VKITQLPVNVNGTEVLRPIVRDRQMREFHILRLGSRIFDLRKEGYEIEERKVGGKSWSEYRLRPTRKTELPPAFEPKVMVCDERNQLLF